MKKVEHPSPMSARAAISVVAEGAIANRRVPAAASTAVASMVFFGP